MLSLPKQQSHKKDLPTVFEGNKQNEQQGPITTFKNWASEVQIYMSLEDHKLASILEDTKTQKQSIVDAHYIDYYLHEQALGQKDVDEIKEKELDRLLKAHARDIAPILRRNAENARRRREGDDGVPADEGVPATPELPKDFKPFTDDQQKIVDEFTEAFNHYSRVLQYILTKVTKTEPYKFVVQCNHNNASGPETWRTPGGDYTLLTTKERKHNI
eukprot:3097443-Amphidinium_carterae.2